jgi:ubiquinone/menaquinone biosynthesis C-methylase UbiE
VAIREGWHGWDDYAPFYDWENAQTMGRRDVAFWRRLARSVSAPTLELGCGTGRVLVPIARSGARATGIDRSVAMLARASARACRLPPRDRPALVRGDIRRLPYASAAFGLVIAAYGLSQSLLNDADLEQVLAESGRVLIGGGLFGLDLVPDLSAWREYTRRIRFRGRSRAGGRLTLVESVRQDRARGLTTFDEEFIEQRGGREKRREFSLTFRTVAVPDMIERLERIGLAVQSVSGTYGGGRWTPTSDTWLIVARKR